MLTSYLLLATGLMGQAEPAPADAHAKPASAADPGLDDVDAPGDLDDLDGLDALDDLDALDELDELTGGGDASIVRGVKGFVSNETRSYLKDRGGSQNDDVTLFEAQLELDLRPFSGLTVFLRPWVLVDALDSDLVRYEPLEAFIEITGEQWDIRMGQFIESWGIADTFNPIAVLNRQDVAINVLNPQVLGEAGIRMRYSFEGGHTVGQPSVAVYVMPVWRETPFPTDASRFSFRFSFSQQGGKLSDEDIPRLEIADATLGALRLEHTLSTRLFNADMQYIVARGPERFPTFTEELVSRPEYFGMTVVGGGFRAIPNVDWWSKLTLKAEVVYKQPYAFDGMSAPLPDAYSQYAVGFDRQVAPFLASKDQLTITVEYVGERGADDITATFRPFNSDLVFRLYWELGNFARTSAEIRGIIDLDNDEVIAEAVIKSQLRFIHEDLSLLIAGQYIRQAKTDPSFFALFPDNSSVRGRLQFDF